jgi:hypothetical protein
MFKHKEVDFNQKVFEALKKVIDTVKDINFIFF